MSLTIHWDTTPRAKWDRLTDRASAPLQQRWAYGEAVARLGGTVFRAEFRQGKEPRAIAQFIARSLLRLLPVALVTGGPLWLSDPDTQDVSEALKLLRAGPPGHRLRIILATPPAPDDTDAIRRAGYIPVMTRATSARLAVQAEQDMRAAMHGKWRNRLTKALRDTQGKISHSTNPADLAWLLAAETSQAKARGYKNLPPGLIQAWAEARPRALRMHILEHQGAPAAAMLFLRHGNTSTYISGWSDPNARPASCHHLLLWHAVKDAREAGLTSLDLGLVDTVRSPGLARFKIGSGAAIKPLGDTIMGFADRATPPPAA